MYAFKNHKDLFRKNLVSSWHLRFDRSKHGMILTSIFLCESAVAVRLLVLGLIVIMLALVESSGGRIFMGIITEPLLCLVHNNINALNC